MYSQWRRDGCWPSCYITSLVGGLEGHDALRQKMLQNDPPSSLISIGKKAALYRSNVVIAPLGDDFRYMTSDEAEAQYKNYQFIKDYVNDHVPGVTMQFGTLSDYFQKLQGSFDVPCSREVS